MFKVATSFLLLMFPVFAVQAAPPNPPTNLRIAGSAPGGAYLTVSGNYLVYNGRVVVLRGENFNNGPALMGSMSSINANAADYAQARNVLGVNHIRFGLDYSWYSASRANFFAVMNQHVAWAKTNHLWMIPTMFMWPGNPNGDCFTGQEAFWNSASNQQLLINFWQDFATHYANEPTIAGYDLVNEPNPPSTSAYTTWAQAAYNAITAVDPHHFVAIESAAPNGTAAGLPNVVGTRILWSSHCYGTVGSGCGFSGSNLNSPSKWPYWVGEMGITGSGSSTGWVPGNLSNYNQQGISWCHFVMRWSLSWSNPGYGLYQTVGAGDFSSPWTQMIQVVQNATSGTVYSQ
jgi:hypothetical protein